MYRKSGVLEALENEMIGRSAAFQYVLNQVRVIAKSQSVVLIQGETGTGKEVIPAPFTIKVPAGTAPWSS